MKEQYNKRMEVQVALQKEELYSLANDWLGFIKTNDKDIESIDYDYTDDYEVNPMSGIEINGYLNRKK